MVGVGGVSVSTVTVGGGGGALGGDGDDDGRGTRAKGVKGGGSARLSRQPSHSAPPASTGRPERRVGGAGWRRRQVLDASLHVASGKSWGCRTSPTHAHASISHHNASRPSILCPPPPIRLKRWYLHGENGAEQSGAAGRGGGTAGVHLKHRCGEGV